MMSYAPGSTFLAADGPIFAHPCDGGVICESVGVAWGFLLPWVEGVGYLLGEWF